MCVILFYFSFILRLTLFFLASLYWYFVFFLSSFCHFKSSDVNMPYIELYVNMYICNFDEMQECNSLSVYRFEFRVSTTTTTTMSSFGANACGVHASVCMSECTTKRHTKNSMNYSPFIFVYYACVQTPCSTRVESIAKRERAQNSTYVLCPQRTVFVR